jgi:hypothetical protein
LLTDLWRKAQLIVLLTDLWRKAQLIVLLTDLWRKGFDSEPARFLICKSARLGNFAIQLSPAHRVGQ